MQKSTVTNPSNSVLNFKQIVQFQPIKKDMKFHHHTARLQATQQILQEVRELKWNILLRLSYYLDLAPFIFSSFLFFYTIIWIIKILEVVKTNRLRLSLKQNHAFFFFLKNKYGTQKLVKCREIVKENDR